MRSIGLCVGIGFALSATAVNAGVYADDMGKCLVAKASSADQTAFMQWLYAALSTSPAVRSMSSISDAQRTQYNKVAAQLFTRLITSDCRSEAVAALKYEGDGALEAAFQVFGRVAARALMSDPDVLKQMQGLDTFFDEKKFEALHSEAGLPNAKLPPSPAAGK